MTLTETARSADNAVLVASVSLVTGECVPNGWSRIPVHSHHLDRERERLPDEEPEDDDDPEEDEDPELPDDLDDDALWLRLRLWPRRPRRPRLPL